MRYSNLPTVTEKLICAFFYAAIFLTFIPFITWLPLVWILIINIRRLPAKDFVKYHCYQALLFNMIALFLPQLLVLLISFLSNLLSIFAVFDGTITLLNSLTVWILSVYYIVIKIAAVYAAIWTLRGKFTYLPPISQAVNMLLR